MIYVDVIKVKTILHWLTEPHHFHKINGRLYQLTEYFKSKTQDLKGQYSNGIAPLNKKGTTLINKTDILLNHKNVKYDAQKVNKNKIIKPINID